MKYIKLLLFGVAFLFPLGVSAKTYQVSLYYDSQKDEMRLDRLVDEPIRVVDTLDTFSFDVRAELPPENNFLVNLESFQYAFSQTLVYPYQDGAFTINVQYYPHVKELQIRSATSQPLVIDVSEFSTCNQNNICEYELEETDRNCYSDCGREVNQYSQQTQSLLQAQNGVIRDQDGTILIDARERPESSEDQATSDTRPSIIFLISGILLIVGALGTWIFLKFKKS